MGNGLIAGVKAYQSNQTQPDRIDTMFREELAPPSMVVDDIHVQLPDIGPISYTVHAGDTLSGYAGTSDPATIGMLMYLNGLSSYILQPGQQLISGNLSDYSPDQIGQFQQSGQAVLNQSNAVIAAQASENAALAALQNLTAVPGVVDSFTNGGSAANVNDAYVGYSLATAGTGVGNSSAETPNANLPFDPTNETLIGVVKGLINTPSTVFNAEQRIKGWYESLTGHTADQTLQNGSVPGLLGAGQRGWDGSAVLVAPPIAPYSNGYQQLGGDFSGIATLAIPGLGEADSFGLYVDGMSLFGRGGASAAEVLDASGGSFLVPNKMSGLDKLVPNIDFATNLDQPASSINAADALSRKLSALQNAQQTAAGTAILDDGRVLYYSEEVPARTPGPTQGASLVTEYDPATGNVRQYYESYDQAGDPIRVHPKMINGQVVNSPHFPPTAKELGQ